MEGEGKILDYNCTNGYKENKQDTESTGQKIVWNEEGVWTKELMEMFYSGLVTLKE